MSLPYEYRDIKDELVKVNEQLDIIILYLKKKKVVVNSDKVKIKCK